MKDPNRVDVATDERDQQYRTVLDTVLILRDDSLLTPSFSSAWNLPWTLQVMTGGSATADTV